MVFLPCSKTIQCTGRTNSASPAPQRIRRGIGSALSAFSINPGSSSATALPFSTLSNVSHSPLSVLLRPSFATSTAHFLAKAVAAGVGLPSSSKAIFTGGPFCSTLRSSCRAARSVTSTVRRLGLANVFASPCDKRTSSIPAISFSPKASIRERNAFGGNSSVPISTRKSSALLIVTAHLWRRTQPSENRVLHGSQNRPHRLRAT